MTLNWLSIAIVVAIVQGVILLLALANRSERNHPANRFLLFLVANLIVSLGFRLTYVQENEFFLQYPHVPIIGDAVMFIIGPSLYFYVKILIKPTWQAEQRDYWHALPLFLFLCSFAYLLTMSREELLAVHFDGSIYAYYLVVLSAAITQLIVYVGMSLPLMREMKEADSHNYQPYVRFFLMVMLGVGLCWIPAHLLTIWPGINMVLSNIFYQVSFLLISLSVFLLTFLAIRSPELFLLPVRRTPQRYASSSLTKEKATAIKTNLLSCFHEDRPFLDSDLSLPKLATALEVNHVHLSQVINEHYGKSFSELVNEYRVEEFINRAQSGAFNHLTLIAIARECGFNTKTSFNKAFKKSKGLTPTQFLKHSPSDSSKTV